MPFILQITKNRVIPLLFGEPLKMLTNFRFLQLVQKSVVTPQDLPTIVLTADVEQTIDDSHVEQLLELLYLLIAPEIGSRRNAEQAAGVKQLAGKKSFIFLMPQGFFFGPSTVLNS